MKNRISFKKEFYPAIRGSDIPPDFVIKQAVLDSKELSDKEDYFEVGDDIYIYLKTALYILGRFMITDVSNAIPIIEHLSVPDKKYYSGFNDDNLPPLDEREQEWNDGIIPIIRENAKFLKIEYNDLLRLVYGRMNVNFPYYTGIYLDKIGMPGNTRITKFRVVTCNKDLRIKFEDAMSEIMRLNAVGELKIEERKTA